MKRLLRLPSLWVALTLVGLVGCQSPMAWRGATVGGLVVEVNASERTILPAVVVASYSVSGSGPSGATLPATAQTASTFSLSSLAVGPWTLVVNGLDAAGNAVASGSSTVVVVAGTVASTTVALGPLTGTGTFTLNITWTGSRTPGSGFSGSLTSVEGSILPTTGAAIPLKASLSGTSAASTTGTLASGSYLVTLTFTDSSGKTMVATEALQVFKGLTSAKSIGQSDLDKAFWAGAAGQTTETLPIDLAHWTKSPTKNLSPAPSVIAEGILLPGGIHVNPGPPEDGNGVIYNTPFDLRNKTVSTKFKVISSAYMVVASGPTDPTTGAGLGGYFKLTSGLGMNTTHHAYLSTTLIPSDTWIFEEWTFSATTGWSWKTATGSYPSQGGTLITSKSGAISATEWANLSNAKWSFGFGDNYGGTSVSAVLGEVTVAGAGAVADPVNRVTNPGFENDLTGYSLEPYGSATTATFTVDTTVSHTGSKSLKITNGNPEGSDVYKGFIATIPGLTPNTVHYISFWARSQAAASNQTLYGIFDGALGQPWSQRINASAGTYDWTLFTGTYNPGASNSMTLRWNTGAVGVVWLDDISVSTAPPTTVATSGVSISPTSLSLTAGGATGSLTATVAPTTATNKAVIWTTSDSSVATVSGGVVTPVARGTATITASTVEGTFSATSTISVVTASPVYSGMVARYSFDASAEDQLGNYSGTVVGSGVVFGPGGVRGKGATFGGSGYIEAPHIPLDHRDFTVSLWVKMAVSDQSTALFGQGLTAGYTNSLHIHLVSGNRVRFTFWGDNLDSNASVGTGEWHHVVTTYSLGTGYGTTYIDGVLDTSGPKAAFADTSGPTWIGHALSGGAMNGSLDEVGIWSRALSGSEVASLYAAEKPVAVTGSLPIDLNSWSQNVVKENSPAPTLGANGIVMAGAPHSGQDGNGIVYKTALNLMNRTVSTKYLVQTSGYLWTKSFPVNIATGLQVCEQSVNATTDHSFGGSILIPSNTWIYEEWSFSSTGWSWKLATGTYPSLGGTLLTNQSGVLTAEKAAALASCHWASNFGDNYGGGADSLVLAEVSVN